MHDKYEKHQRAITRGARSALLLAKCLGWDAEDCAQEARLAFLSLPAKTLDVMTDRLAYTIARRTVIAAARTRFTNREPDGQTLVETIEARSPQVSVELVDLVQSAPAYIREYLGARVFDGLTWAETCETLDVGNDKLASIRAAAADWLLAQLEGRK